MTDYRERALEEYGNVCHACGDGGHIEVHHRDGDRTNNGIDNLVPLCRSCHAQVHGLGLNGLEDELKPVEEREHRDVCSTVSLRISERLNNRLHAQLSYGDSKSDFIREALHRKLESNPNEVDGERKGDGGHVISTRLFDGLESDIREHLEYGDSKSAFIRCAIREQLDRLEDHQNQSADWSETEQSDFSAHSGGERR